jgi:hypothetical protein
VKHGCKLDSRKFSFSHRIIDTWNSLSDDITTGDSVNSFEVRLYNFLVCRGFILA